MTDKTLPKKKRHWLCLSCRHFNARSSTSGNPTCEAFPEGIPDAVQMGHETHRTHLPNDNGLKYQKESS